MTTKQISRMVILTAVIVSLVVLLVKLIQGTAGIVGSLFNTVLGIVVVLALVIIVVWMFAYAKKSRKKQAAVPGTERKGLHLPASGGIVLA